MVESDKEQFRLAMAAMAEMYRVDCPPTLQKTYWIVCQSMSIEQFKTAVAKAMRTLKWFPKPAELFELCGDSSEDQTSKAWAVLNRAIDDVGGYRSPRFTDGILVATIESLGGWQYVCGMPVKEFESFFRNRFMETYQSYARSGVSSDRPLVGIHDANRGRIGRGQAIGIGDLVSKVLPEQAKIGVSSDE